MKVFFSKLSDKSVAYERDIKVRIEIVVLYGTGA
jgi:hypothetical protein